MFVSTPPTFQKPFITYFRINYLFPSCSSSGCDHVIAYLFSSTQGNVQNINTKRKMKYTYIQVVSNLLKIHFNCFKVI